MSGNNQDFERTVARGIQRQKDAEKAAGSCGGIGCLGIFALMIAAISYFHVPDSSALGVACVAIPLIGGGVIYAKVHRKGLNE